MADAIRVVIHGRVQGVGYRAWTVAQASKMGIKGWVRNRTDGTVEAVFSGDEQIVSSMVEACKNGPLLARVNRIESFRYTEEVDTSFTSKPTL